MNSGPHDKRLNSIGGRNAALVRALAHMIAVMCNGEPGRRVFLGAHSLADALGTSASAAHRAVQRLEALGILQRLRTGGLCRNDDRGQPYDEGRVVRRASDFLFMGFDVLTSA